MRWTRRRLTLTGLCMGPVLAVSSVLFLSSGPAGGYRVRPAAEPPAAEPTWIPVHPERQARLGGKPVYGICFDGLPPRRLAGGPPRRAPDSPLRRAGGVIVAHCLVDEEGYVVTFQVLKAPAGTDPQAVAGALAAWRFEPARRAGRPVAVHYTVAIHLPRDPALDSGSATPSRSLCPKPSVEAL